MFWSKCLEDGPMPVSRSTVAAFEHRYRFDVLHRADWDALPSNCPGSVFDGVEMLEVTLDENELSHEIPRSFEEGIIVVVCFSFLLSTLQLMEIKMDDGDWKPRKCTSVSRKTLQILFVNGVFLVLRLILFRKYGKDASIFIAKNGIIIFLSLFEICSTYKCCGCEDY